MNQMSQKYLVFVEWNVVIWMHDTIKHFTDFAFDGNTVAAMWLINTAISSLDIPKDGCLQWKNTFDRYKLQFFEKFWGTLLHNWTLTSKKYSPGSFRYAIR